MNETILFLDTNILIHFKPFHQINWHEIVTKKNLDLALSTVTIKELDELKYKAPSKIRERSQKVLSQIKQLLGNDFYTNINKNTGLLYIPDSHNVAVLGEFNLNQESRDDCFLAIVIAFQREHHTKNIILVTADTGVLLKAKALGVEAIELPSKFALPIVKDEYETKMQKLKEENEKLKNKLPKLFLTFSNKETYIKKQLKPPLKISPNYVNDKVKLVMKKYPYKNIELEKSLFPFQAVVENLNKESFDKYNKQLEHFYETYKNYLQDKINHLNKLRISIKLNLRIINNGNVPANNIEINLHFPDGFDLLNSEDMEFEFEEPTAPEYKHPLQLHDLTFPSHYFSNIQPIQQGINPPNISAPKIKKTESYDVSLQVIKLKHNMYLDLCSFHVTFESIKKAKNFDIEYVLLADNHPEPMTGKLNVIIGNN